MPIYVHVLREPPLHLTNVRKDKSYKPPPILEKVNQETNQVRILL